MAASEANLDKMTSWESQGGPLVSRHRRELMKRVKAKNTTPEMIVRKFLHGEGYRYSLHAKRLPGSPDILMARRRLAIFVHGCFWHRHAGCRATSNPTTRAEFWQAKFSANVDRDRRAVEALSAAGWQTHVVWECQTKGAGSFRPDLLAVVEACELRKPVKLVRDLDEKSIKTHS